jgi:hypothetical protein
MTAGSLTHLGTTDRRIANPAPKSLFQNILAATPYGSIFCGHPLHPATRNCLRMNIIEERQQKNIVRCLHQRSPIPQLSCTGIDGSVLVVRREINRGTLLHPELSFLHTEVFRVARLRLDGSTVTRLSGTTCTMTRH